MTKRLLAAVGVLGGAALCCAADFEPPVRLTADGAPIKVEAPGYACPCLADVEGKGRLDLVVGQFNKGKMQVFRGLGGATFARGAWLQAGGAAAEVPGVW